MPNYQIEPNNTVDDLGGTDADINSIAKRLIDPIDRIRSSTVAPNITLRGTKGKKITVAQAILNESEGISIDTRDPVESRCHAFYRMIGVPVMDRNGGFYSPGFNPDEQNNTVDHMSIITNISPLIKSLQKDRESEFKNRKLIFLKQGIDASAYTLATRYPKKFKLIENDSDPQDHDPQRFFIDDRQQYLSKIKTPSGNSLNNFFQAGSHILKPFMTDPIIEKTVMPGKNKIAAPFLKDKNSVRLERDVFLLRPILEFVCVNRLIQPQEQTTLIKNLFSKTQNDPNVQFTSNDLNSIVQVLLGDSAVFNETNLSLATGSPSLISLNNVNALIKQLKTCVKLLVDAMRTLDKINSPNGINIFPIPNENGPELGIDIGKLVKTDSNTKLELQILNLQINKEISENSIDATDKNKGQYAGSFSQNIQKNFDGELQSAIEQRNQYGSLASQAFRTIELVTGEISGLGLVDIIALYIALWSVDLNALIALLDEDAFIRMTTFNKGLITPEVQSRLSGTSTVNGKTALTKFEQRVTSILEFSDHLMEQYLLSPNYSELGSQ